MHSAQQNGLQANTNSSLHFPTHVYKHVGLSYVNTNTDWHEQAGGHKPLSDGSVHMI
jgi:hypothetical protein